MMYGIVTPCIYELTVTYEILIQSVRVVNS